MNLYLKKISHDDSSDGSKINSKYSKIETNNHLISKQINIPHTSVGYSFAINEPPAQQK